MSLALKAGTKRKVGDAFHQQDAAHEDEYTHTVKKARSDNLTSADSDEIDTISERKVSRLESLPGEILNEIYRYTVVEADMISAVAYHDNGIRTNEPAFARTCRRFRHEVLSIYYSENIFKFPITLIENLPKVHSGDVRGWLEAIGPTRALYIKRVGAKKRIMNHGNGVSAIRGYVVAEISSETIDWNAWTEGGRLCDGCCARLMSITEQASQAYPQDVLERRAQAMTGAYDHFKRIIALNGCFSTV